MSMISLQCDELRDVADDLDRVTNGIRSGVPASTWHGMTYVFDSAAKSLRQAADTIWELRCKLAGVVDQQGEIDRLKAKNNRLREMVEAVLQCTGVAKRDKGCDACPMYDKSKAISIKSEWCRLRPMLRELGIEEDE